MLQPPHVRTDADAGQVLTFDVACQILHVVVVVAIGTAGEPDEGSFDVGSRRSRPESQSWIVADPAFVQLPFGGLEVNGLHEEEES